jgi:hypothetical protein
MFATIKPNSRTLRLAAGLLLTGCAAPQLPSLPTLRAQNGLSEAQVKEVVQRLVWAQGLAKGRKELPFRLSCTDEDHSGVCKDGGRPALASLPISRIGSIRPIFNTECVRSLFEYPEDHCPDAVRGQPRKIDAYEINLPHAAGGGLTWKVGLAPADGVEAIELERGIVIYH